MGTHRKPHVLIIGAGLAGLSAAEHLVKGGLHDITVLEARDRVGGRIHTIYFGQKGNEIIELGANWIHGAAATNSVFVLANEHNLLERLVLFDRMDGYYCYRSDGKAINRDLSNRLWELFQSWDPKLTPGSAYGQMTHAEYFNSKLQETLDTEFQQADHEDVQCVFNCLMNWWKFHTAGFPEKCPVVLKDQDFHKTGDRKLTIPGGNVSVPAGMDQIIRCIYKTLHKGSVKYEHEVKNIKWSDPIHPGQVYVDCTNGKTFQCDQVIVTLPLGVLKKNYHTLFTPSLPQDKIDAIERIYFGKVDKIFLLYDKPFWQPGTGSIKLAWRTEDMNKLSVNEWYRAIFGFDEVLNNPNVLVAWISGEEAEIMEKVPEEEIKEICTELMRSFLQNPSIPSPRKVVRSTWCTNPFSLGAYCYPGMESKPAHFLALAKPLFDTNTQIPRVLFAGEATIIQFHSTMNGARSSGLKEAQNIISQYKSMRTARL